jgi:hypothetical protein
VAQVVFEVGGPGLLGEVGQVRGQRSEGTGVLGVYGRCGLWCNSVELIFNCIIR